jgi:hypothetical protein
MTPQNLAIVGLRLIGIYLVITSGSMLAALSVMAGFMTQIVNSQGLPDPTPPSLQAATFIVPLLQFLIGLGLIFGALSLARRICPTAEDGKEKEETSLENIQAIAFAVTGLLILANDLPVLGQILEGLYYWLSEPSEAITHHQARYSFWYSVGVVAQIILGLYLLLNAHGFRKIWNWLRTAGTRPPK